MRFSITTIAAVAFLLTGVVQALPRQIKPGSLPIDLDQYKTDVSPDVPIENTPSAPLQRKTGIRRASSSASLPNSVSGSLSGSTKRRKNGIRRASSSASLPNSVSGSLSGSTKQRKETQEPEDEPFFISPIDGKGYLRSPPPPSPPKRPPSPNGPRDMLTSSHRPSPDQPPHSTSAAEDQKVPPSREQPRRLPPRPLPSPPSHPSHFRSIVGSKMYAHPPPPPPIPPKPFRAHGSH